MRGHRLDLFRKAEAGKQDNWRGLLVMQHDNRSLRALRLLGTRSNQLLAKAMGERLGHVLVSEFPRSGGTWLSNMVAAYLDMEKPHQPYVPLLKGRVIQNHWGYSKNYPAAIYLYRDGRDVCISHYHFYLRGLRDENSYVRSYFNNLYPALESEHWSVENSKSSLPNFIEAWSKRPIGCRIPWGLHVDQWLKNGSNVVPVSYESLNLNPAVALENLVIELLGAHHQLNREKLESVIHQYSFQNLTGRAAGESREGDFLRKGIVGDWKNHFTRESAELFQCCFGGQLRALGYTTDKAWVESVDD